MAVATNNEVELKFVEDKLIPDEDFMKLYHKLGFTTDDLTTIQASVHLPLSQVLESPVNYSVEYTVAYVKYRMFLCLCEQMVVDKLAGTKNRASLNDVVVKDIDSNLWSTLDMYYCNITYNKCRLGFINYKSKAVVVSLYLLPLDVDNAEFLYKLPLLEQKFRLVRLNCRGEQKEIGLFKIKDINKNNLIKWARGN